MTLLALSLMVVSSVPGPAPAGAVSIGNTACGHIAIAPTTGITGGTPVTVTVKWLGSPSTTGCVMPHSNCGSTYFGSCHAGYWLVAVFCNTLAATDLAHAQDYCDLHNVIVLTDFNSGPNDPSDNHGTSYNQCTTVNLLGSVFGGLPGTLDCTTDGVHSMGWVDHWRLGLLRGHAVGSAPETGSSVPFSPAASGIDCPPSAANIAAGAIPNTCALVVMPLEFRYTCVIGCVPDPSLPNDGVTEQTSDFLATLFQYG
jgi:hypothetical protein